MKPRGEVVRALFVFDEWAALFEVPRVIMVRVIDEAQRLGDTVERTHVLFGRDEERRRHSED